MRSTSLLTLVLLTSSLCAGVPTEPAKRAAIIGTPAALAVEPANLVLSGPRSMQQLVVTARYADGAIRDLTPLCSYTVDQPIIALDQTGLVVAAKNGTATLTIQAGPQTLKLPVAVKEYEKPRPVSFRNE